MALKKATKEQAKLRLAIYGLSGGGKTYSSLAIATGLVQVLGGKIAVLDTEFRSASKYANQFEFMTDDFGPPSIENYVKFIEMVKEETDVTVLVIDSLTHAWQYILETVDKLKETTAHGDGRKAWSIMTPEYKKLVNAILTAPFHVVGTMRAKTEWSTTNEGGHKTVRRDTLAPEQRDGFEYEFDMLMELNANHYGTIIKDRTNKFQDEIIQKPGVEFGRKLAEWLKDGAVPMENQIQSVLQEIGLIIKSKSESGAAFFNEQEYESIREMCKESAYHSQEVRLEFLQSVLADQKKILQVRVDQFEVTALTGNTPPPKPEEAAMSQPDTNAHGAAAVPLSSHPPPAPPSAAEVSPVPVSQAQHPAVASQQNEKPGLSEGFKQMLREKELARQAMMTPQESENPQEYEDDFEDDLLDENRKEEAAELDIF